VIFVLSLEKFYFSNKNTFLLVTKLYSFIVHRSDFFCFAICCFQIFSFEIITNPDWLPLFCWSGSIKSYWKLMQATYWLIVIILPSKQKSVRLLKITSYHSSSLIIKDEEYLSHVLSGREILQRIRKSVQA